MSVPLLLAPGASGSVAGLRPFIIGLAARGIEAEGVELPRGTTERALPRYRAALEATAARRIAIGGQSFGGRVASLLAVERELAGLLLISYPLHRPGHAEEWEARTDHWPRIACPVLLLSGASDPFAHLDLLERAAHRLAVAELVTYPRLRHGIGAVLEDALDRVAAWIAGLAV